MDVTQEATQPLPFRFTGTGSGYFRIWIVNLALTVLTLGIYSAWAKVRRLQYFYRNTSLAGSSFDFHGDPKAILKGRVIAVLLLVGYNVLGNLHIGLGLAAFAVLVAVLPWLLQRSLSFRLHYTSYRGLRFRFAGGMGGAYQAFLLWPLVAYCTLGLLAPIAHREIKAYQHGNSRFGDAAFGFTASAGQFYGIYLRVFGVFLLGVVVLVATLVAGFAGSAEAGERSTFMHTILLAIVVFYLVLFLVVGPWFAARIQNLVWGHTALGPHAFRSNVRARDLFWIYITNVIGIVLTLGLFKPFADVRLARYRLSRMALAAASDLGEFVAAQEQAASALGEEAADVFDVDISF